VAGLCTTSFTKMSNIGDENRPVRRNHLLILMGPDILHRLIYRRNKHPWRPRGSIPAPRLLEGHPAPQFNPLPAVPPEPAPVSSRICNLPRHVVIFYFPLHSSHFSLLRQYEHLTKSSCIHSEIYHPRTPVFSSDLKPTPPRTPSPQSTPRLPLSLYN